MRHLYHAVNSQHIWSSYNYSSYCWISSSYFQLNKQTLVLSLTYSLNDYYHQNENHMQHLYLHAAVNSQNIWSSCNYSSYNCISSSCFQLNKQTLVISLTYSLHDCEIINIMKIICDTFFTMSLSIVKNLIVL